MQIPFSRRFPHKHRIGSEDFWLGRALATDTSSGRDATVVTPSNLVQSVKIKRCARSFRYHIFRPLLVFNGQKKMMSGAAAVGKRADSPVTSLKLWRRRYGSPALDTDAERDRYAIRFDVIVAGERQVFCRRRRHRRRSYSLFSSSTKGHHLVVFFIFPLSFLLCAS